MKTGHSILPEALGNVRRREEKSGSTDIDPLGATAMSCDTMRQDATFFERFVIKLRNPVEMRATSCKNLYRGRHWS
jgi:hypothetical protein